VSNSKALKDAIAKIAYYGNVVSLDDFYLKAMQMQWVNSPYGDTGDPGVEIPADSFLFEVINDISDGGLFTNEIVGKIDEFMGGTGSIDFGAVNAAGDKIWTDEKIAQFELAAEMLNASFCIVCPDALPSDGASVRLTSITLNDMLKDQIGSAAVSPTAPTKVSPSLSIIQVLPAMLSFGSRNTGAVEVFMNMIPTLEWTRSVPYLDIELITPGPATSTKNGKEMIGDGISHLRFLKGVSEITGPDLIVAQGETIAVGAMNSDSVEQFSSAGMEIFTSPQTLVPQTEVYRSYDEVAAFDQGHATNPEGTIWPGQMGAARTAPVIDRMRPFMSLNSVNISIKPTRGMMSHKSAEIKLTLHDRSRLAEIGALVRPSAFGQTELLLEWGWSHPDAASNNGSDRNVYGQFINANRVKEKFGVYNSKYNFKDDGQVEVTLSCVTKGADSVNVTNVGLSPLATLKYQALEALIEAIRELRKKVMGPDMPDIAGMSTISNISPTNAGDMFLGEKFEEIQKFLNDARGATGDLAALKKTLMQAKATTSSLQTTVAGVIDKKVGIAKKTGDAFLKPRGESVGSTVRKHDTHPSYPKDGSSWCSFGRLAALFIGAPLMETKRFNEVQMIFYCFNDKASFMHDQSIASFPVDLAGNTGFVKLFAAWQAEKIQVSVASFMSFMNRYYLTNMASKAYGFNNIFTRDEDGKATVAKNVSVSQLSSKKDAVLKKAYGEDADVAFKLPRIRMATECVPHIKTTGDEETAAGSADTILRLHFYDNSAAKYAGLHDILTSIRSSEMGAVRNAANAVSATDGASDSNWAQVTSEYQAKMDKMGLLEKNKEGDYYSVVGGAPALKYFIRQAMPSILFGSQNCALQSLSMGSMHNSADTTIHMMRAQRESTSDSGTPGEQDRGLPIRMMPMQVSGQSMGCPLLSHGQQFFIDMGTGTSADNVYAVSGLDHSIEPGKFTTKFKLIPIDAFGKYESAISQVNKALGVISNAEAAEGE
jgi:hypothetical protein